ncbi:MAG: nucleotidyl transferase AbiEii/AbiGii toxin family protein [Planctomycetes bacterium]|nr:nucleotidyl transferase AbiEii/AbiGii toxin family protein [Planctomycetota bacterium]
MSGKSKRGFTRSELLRRLESALRLAPDIQYAIGGATALAVHGYRRFTRDVDVFVLERDLNTLMRALRTVGLDVFAISEPSQYGAKLPGDPDPERRIDVLVPNSEPELSAVEYAVESRRFRVFSPNLLAMAKFYALDDSADPRHAYDLLAMYRRGMFDPAAVQGMIASIDPERVEAYEGLIRSFTTVGTGKTRKARPRKRLPPMGSDRPGG